MIQAEAFVPLVPGLPSLSTMTDSSQVGFVPAQGAFVRRLDFDGDEFIDIILVNHSNGDLVWYEQEEFAWSTPRAVARLTDSVGFTSPTLSSQVVIGDTDLDGLDEVFISDWAENHGVRSVQYLPEKENFETTQVFEGSLWSHLKLADVDLDGDLDLLGLRAAPQGLGPTGILLLGENDQGSFDSSGELMLPLSVTDFSLGDLNRDGLLDVVIGEGIVGDALGNPYQSFGVSYIPQLEDGEFGEVIRVAEAVGTCAEILVADVNRDGREDVVPASRTSASIEVFLNEELPEMETFVDWLLDVGDATGDPDEDDRANLAEYYFGSDPLMRDAGSGFEMRMSPEQVYGENFKFSALRRRGLDPREWKLVIEVSSDLTEWTEVPAGRHSVTRVGMPQGRELVEVRIGFSMSSQYARWRLVYDPIQAE